MEKILRPARPGAKPLAKTKQTGDINLYDNLITYTYKAINGADRNRAKIALYEMINKAKKFFILNWETQILTHLPILLKLLINRLDPEKHTMPHLLDSWN